MAYTNFPNGITSFGVPVVGGINGIPLTGSWFFVDYVNGSDGNGSRSSSTALGGNQGGASPEAPLKTLERAHELALAGNNDVVVIMGDGSSAGTQRLSETLVWSKNATHIIGMTAPTMIGQRARISTVSGATTNTNPLVQVTADGCIFANFSLFQGVGESATAEQLWTDEGERNYYWNIQFGGMGHANSAAVATSYCLYLNGGGEHTFQSCVFGLDTIARSAANTTIKVANQVARCTFLDCEFPMYATATSPFFVDCNSAASLNRWIKFKRCSFFNVQGLPSSALLTVAFSFNAAQNGDIRLEDCTWYGATDLASGDTARLLLNMPVASDDAGGQMVAWDITP